MRDMIQSRLSIMPLIHHYLRYSVWAVAAVGAKEHCSQSGEYYTKARHLVEASAVADPRSTQFGLWCTQAWLHLAMHDMMCGRFALVWMNTCQAIRLLQIGNVHNLDMTNPCSRSQDSMSSHWSHAEESRRAFWFAFCMDKSAFVGKGLPSLINEKDVCLSPPCVTCGIPIDMNYRFVLIYPCQTRHTNLRRNILP